MLCHENIIGLQLDHSCNYEIATRCGTSAWKKIASLVIVNFVVQCNYGLVLLVNSLVNMMLLGLSYYCQYNYNLL